MWAQASALLHIGFLSTLLLGVLAICFLEPRRWGEWVVVAFTGLFLVSFGEAYIGLLVGGPDGWPWDKGPFPYSPTLWNGAWPSESWTNFVVLMFSQALTLGGLALLGMRWALLQTTDRARALERQEPLPTPLLGLLLLSGGELLAWPTWITITTWFALTAVSAVAILPSGGAELRHVIGPKQTMGHSDKHLKEI